MKITRIESVRVPPPIRSRLSLTDEAARSELVAVQLRTDTDHIGVGFTTCQVAGESICQLIRQEIAPHLIGAEAVDNERLFAKAQAKFQSTGWAGLASRAFAAIDIAFWDLKAKASGLPLYRLLGGARSSAACFAGDMAAIGTDPQRTIESAMPLLEQGMLGVAVDVGSGDVQQDADRVQQIRDGIGESAWLGISAGGRYDLGTALAMAHFYEEDVGIDWMELPIPATDRVGYQRLAERMEVPIALGASFDDRDDFLRVLESGHVRILRPDILRLGGITPLIKIAAIAEAFHIQVVPYRLPEIGVHLACGLSNVPFAEWGTWTASGFAEPIAPKLGRLNPPDRNGHGMEWNAATLRLFDANRT